MSLYSGINLPGHPDLANIQKLDLLPIPMARRMERYGIAINVPGCHDLTSRLESQMDTLRADIADCIPPEHLDSFLDASDSIDDWCPINVESGAQLADLLFNMLEVGRGKQLKTTKSGTRLSTGKKQLELLKKDNPVIPLILQYRERSKLRNTYTLKFPKIAKFHPRGKCCPVCELAHISDSHRIHTTLLWTRTDTGRAASKNPNLQNIPSKTPLGREVRELFIASPGRVLVSRDYAQIELRLLAHCAADTLMMDIFRRNGDIHVETAMNTFGITDPSKVDKLLHRAPCKNLNFGICLAEGQKVLTHFGHIPIEKVTSQMLLWDGCSWVPHQGVVYMGEKEVITHDGITATPDHNIWTMDGRKLPLSQALAERRRIAITASGDIAIRYPSDYFEGSYQSGGLSSGMDEMLQMPEDWPVLPGQSTTRPIPPLHVSPWSEVSQSSSGQESYASVLRHYSTLFKSSLRIMDRLWQAWHKKQISIYGALRLLYSIGVATLDLQKSGYWTKKQRWTLRTGEPCIGDPSEESFKYPSQSAYRLQRGKDYCNRAIRKVKRRLSWIFHRKNTNQGTGGSGVWMGEHSNPQRKTAKVYDIVLAGPNHRFTCEGKLVSNCYGLTESGLYDNMALTYAIAGLPLPAYITVDWCKSFISDWFGVYQHVLPYMELQYYRARRYGYVWEQLGRIRRVPEVRSCMGWLQSAGLRQSGNMPIQGLAAGVMKIGMARVENEVLLPWHADGIWCWPLLPVHDELIIESDEDYAEELGHQVGTQMDLSMTDTQTSKNLCTVPIRSDGKVMDRWIKE